MSSHEGFGGDGDYAAEVRRDPEVDELLEFLGVYGKIQKIMAGLIEGGANVDFTLKAVRRAQLQNLMQQLGLDPEDPHSFTQLENMKANLSDRRLRPEPRIEVPEVGFFKSRITELIADQARYGEPTAPSHAIEGQVSIAGVARYGHTNWADVQSRTGGHVSEWIHGVATIMADPVAYQAQFAGLGIDAGRRTADHLEIAEDWSIKNGRHRSLAVRSLGEEYVLESGMAQWVPVTVEQV